MNRAEQTLFINQITKGLKKMMISAVKEGKIPKEWDGHELRHLMLAMVESHYAYSPLDKQRKKDFKNHLLITPGLI